MLLKSHGDDRIIPLPAAIGSMNPILSSPTSILNNEDLAASPPSAQLSDYQKPRRPDSRTPSFSTSASSMSCSPSSFLISPYESPFHSSIPSSSAVPFSWERQPGIPKFPDVAAGRGDKEAKFLPLPPPLRSTTGYCRRRRSDAGEDDPFFAALSQCAKDCSPTSEDDMDALGWSRSAGKSVGIWRRTLIANRIGLVSLYGSCKTACSVSDAIIVVPRSSRRAAGSYGRMNMRSE
ncbi:hypothetical protein KSP39_PZI003533 [Platanthera zijinensis]|uniref:Uncharacterized protein n=1 Tax=Platanthera zijinensis TaxID=2320716 RepID=A0AAP0BTW6_9ASPA